MTLEYTAADEAPMELEVLSCECMCYWSVTPTTCLDGY